MRILRLAVSSAVAITTCALVACVVQQAPADPTTVATTPSSSMPPPPVPSAAPDATTVFVGSADASVEAAPTVTEDAATAVADAGSATPSADAGSAVAFQACAMDSDCVSVPRVSCCNNGYREAVNAGKADAYKRSFTCPPPKPMCAMFMINDNREPECNNGSHLCELVAVEKIACGGFIKNQHRCPTGFHCQLSKVPDVPGTCVP